MSSDAAVETHELRRRYGDVEAPAGVDLSVERGTVFGLLGPNGAGKTTAVRILTTLLRPDAGGARGWPDSTSSGSLRACGGASDSPASTPPCTRT
jgi:ABC-type multidrug transport system ATPase subunit